MFINPQLKVGTAIGGPWRFRGVSWRRDILGEENLSKDHSYGLDIEHYNTVYLSGPFFTGPYLATFGKCGNN